jgi:uncharacterized pyridoxamine 5'-phosphate oxidase family protein
MNKQEIFELINKNPVFFLATLDGNQPRVRGMLIYTADQSGIVFHTAVMRDVYKQVIENPQAELCFNDLNKGIQIRVSGELEIVDDNNLKDEIAAHPSRTFLKPWKESISVADFHASFAVLRLKNGTATIWTFANNLEPKAEVKL